MEPKIVKYPRTPHLEGSRLQPGDEDLTQIPFATIANIPLVVEEKCDGANVAVSFDAQGGLLLQSRGHYFRGGWRERHYDLFKQWGAAHRVALWRTLGSRYILYGEWMYAMHRVFYDALPHYLIEFDVLDRATGRYLDTPSRRALLSDLPIVSAPVLHTGALRRAEDLLGLLADSRFIRPGHMTRLRNVCALCGEDAQQRCAQTDPSTVMEGLYIKVEHDGEVQQRMKFVRPSFQQCGDEPQTQWLDRPIVPNQLTCALSDLFAATLPKGGSRDE